MPGWHQNSFIHFFWGGATYISDSEVTKLIKLLKSGFFSKWPFLVYIVDKSREDIVDGNI